MRIDIAIDKIECLFGSRLWDTCYCDAWQTLKTAVLGTPTNSDYAAALRVLRAYYGDIDLSKVGGFAEYCVRLNSAQKPNCA